MTSEQNLASKYERRPNIKACTISFCAAAAAPSRSKKARSQRSPEAAGSGPDQAQHCSATKKTLPTRRRTGLLSWACALWQELLRRLRPWVGVLR